MTADFQGGALSSPVSRAWARAARCKAHPLASYFALAYAISWSVWTPAVLAQLGWVDAPPLAARYLHLAGGMGPMIASVVLTARIGGRVGLARLGRSCVRGGAWLAIGALIPGALFAISTVIVGAVSRQAPAWASIGRNPELPECSPLLAAAASVVCYGFGEEVGWRGFALPRLQAEHSALRASLLLALGWAGSPVTTGHLLPNVMGATLSVGTLLLVPLFGSENLSRQPRVVARVSASDHAGESP